MKTDTRDTLGHLECIGFLDKWPFQGQYWYPHTPFKRETLAAKSSTIRLFSVSNISSVDVVLEPMPVCTEEKNLIIILL